jgi:hypothetical protein
MQNDGYKKERNLCKASYNKKTKHLTTNDTKFAFVPSCAYYVCENFKLVRGYDIKTISFDNDDKVYKLESLHMKYDWSDVHE